MRRLRRPHGLAVLAAVAAVAVSANPVGASLPDGRAYELVSPLDTNHNGVNAVKASADGERVALAYQGGVPGSSTGGSSLLLAERTASGWKARSILPERDDLLDTAYTPVSASPDLTEFVVLAFHGFPNLKPSVKLARLGADRRQTLLHTFDASVNTTLEVATSDDMRRVLSNVQQQIEPGHAAGTRNVYDFGSGTPTLVSRMPDGTVPACGVFENGPQGFFAAFGDPDQHWLSADGKRAFFHSGDTSCGGPFNLYMRDLEAGTTTLISGPPLSGADGGAVFLRASADGSQVYYATTTRLDPLDLNTRRDVYRHTVGSGNVCVTCVAADANVRVPSQTEFPVVSEDGSRTYVTTASVLSGDDADGGRSAYLLENGAFTYVAPTNAIHFNSRFGGQATPDGSVLVFRSNSAQLTAMTGSDNGGTDQYYRYDQGDGSLVCISCPDGSVPTHSVPAEMAFFGFAGVDNPRVMSDDGSLIVFRTAEALVPGDVNGHDDVYRWRDGDVALVTDGVTPYSELFGSTATGSQPVGVSSDGDDVFFQSFSSLTPDTAGSDQPVAQVYDARVGGGFPFATPPVQCSDDQCQGLPAAPPALVGIGSTLAGPGNVEAPAPRVRLARVTRAQLAEFARRGRVTIRATASVDGQLRAVARARLGKRVRNVASARKVVVAGDLTAVTLRLSRAARRALAREGALPVAVRVHLSGAPGVQRTALVLKLPATANGR